MTKFHYVSALAGSGKTHSALEYAAKLAMQGEKVLIIQPTRILIDQSLRHLAGRPVRVHRFHSDVSPRVTAQLRRHVTLSVSGGEIVLATHAAFFALADEFPHPERWHLICDEVPQTDHAVDLRLAETHGLVSKAMKLLEDDERPYWEIGGGRKSALEALLGRDDDLLSGVAPLAQRIRSPHWKTFVKATAWNDLVAEETPRERRLTAFSILQPSVFTGFASVTIMGAMMDHSLLYHHWTREDVRFEVQHDITNGLRFHRHHVREPLEIRYAVEKPWSKTACNEKVAIDGMDYRVGDVLRQAVLEFHQDRRFLWIGNTNLSDSFFDTNQPPSLRPQRLPNIPHGLNSYQDFHHVVFLSALNPTPPHIKFLSTVGIDGDSIRDALYHQAVYQAAMRSSLRNPDDENPKSVVVPDKAAADWLAQWFEDWSVDPLAHQTSDFASRRRGRPRVASPKTSAESAQSYRDRLKAELKEQLVLLNEAQSHVVPISSLHETTILTPKSRHEKYLIEDNFHDAKIESDAGRVLYGSLFGNCYQTRAGDLSLAGTDDEFIAQLERCYHEHVTEKQANVLISPALFDPDADPETKRGIANVFLARGIWLDNDGGDLTPSEFARIFSRTRIVAYSTYSGGNRYRIFIPTTAFVSAEVYELITDWIMGVLKGEGYYSPRYARRRENTKSHGFDDTKFHAAAMFYLPCQSVDPASSFFTDFNGPERKPLDPYAVVKQAAMRKLPPRDTTMVPLLPPTSKADEPEWRHKQQERIEEAHCRYAAVPAGLSQRHAAFMGLGRRLQFAGLSMVEIEQQLRAADTDGSRARKGQIKDVLKTLKKAWR